MSLSSIVSCTHVFLYFCIALAVPRGSEDEGSVSVCISHASLRPQSYFLTFPLTQKWIICYNMQGKNVIFYFDTMEGSYDPHKKFPHGHIAGRGWGSAYLYDLQLIIYSIRQIPRNSRWRKSKKVKEMKPGDIM